MGLKMSRLIYGIGINDADYVTQINETVSYVDGKQKQKRIWTCPFYITWREMLRRCYSSKYKAHKPTYIGCYVWAEWLLFSNFKSWMQTQDWQGNQLDKDLLFQGNKVYSPETCLFVSGQVNNFLIDSGAARGEYMIGVCWDAASSKFMAQCRNPFTKKGETLGRFASEIEAHKAWLTRKLEHVHRLAELQTDERVAKALINRYIDYK